MITATQAVARSANSAEGKKKAARQEKLLRDLSVLISGTCDTGRRHFALATVKTYSNGFVAYEDGLPYPTAQLKAAGYTVSHPFIAGSLLTININW